MALIDVCNGDADGLFALIQLRLAEPGESTLVTGRKHDIALLDRVQAAPGDRITVCDISIERNASALSRLLEQGASVLYFDHHVARVQPSHPALEAHIDTRSDVCTSLIVDQWLGQRFGRWAAAAAWGDNLAASAEALADRIGLATDERLALRELGESVNYNAYGETDADLMITPADLFARLRAYRDPLDAIAAEPVLGALKRQRADDLERAGSLKPWRDDAQGRLWLLPDAAWSRRVLGPFANLVAAEDPRRAHAVARERADGRLDISVRAPLQRRSGADVLCRAFGGGGRRAAGAIDALPASAFETFVAAFAVTRWGED